MYLFEVTSKKRYSPIQLANAVLHIWRKNEVSTAERNWLKQLASNKQAIDGLLRLVAKHRRSAVYHSEHPFLDDAATCASAYAILSKL